MSKVFTGAKAVLKIGGKVIALSNEPSWTLNEPKTLYFNNVYVTVEQENATRNLVALLNSFKVTDYQEVYYLNKKGRE